MLSRTGIQAAVLTIVAIASAAMVGAHAPSGAIFTTLADGSEVNVNQYSSKDDVYLDGGPGIGAPQTAAGLDDGTYYFQVTDPSGKVLLSEDPIDCRQFTVENGVIVSTAPSTPACSHQTGVDADHNAVTVQLMPYADTPNPGGVYKVWVTFTEDYGCNGTARGCKHGFLPRHSKTDNFKVREVPVIEIDANFIDSATGERLSGRKITWIDPLGASNVKFSYYNHFWGVVEAHVEALEVGTHTIVIENQTAAGAECIVGEVYQGNYLTSDPYTYVGFGPRAVQIAIANFTNANSPYLDVYCQ